jgi:ABC-type multidrug transport system fused ATPase/permease subunit
VDWKINHCLITFTIDSGEIIDGKIFMISIRESSLAMSIVPQDVILFGGTIKENIAYGNQMLQKEITLAQNKLMLSNIEGFPEKFENCCRRKD